MWVWVWVVQAVESKKAVAKRAIGQLAVLADHAFLVSLGDVVAVHALHGLTPVASLSKTKGAAYVSLTSRVSCSSPCVTGPWVPFLRVKSASYSVCVWAERRLPS